MDMDFVYYNPTKIYFGRTALDNLAPELANYGKNILLVYGQGSLKKTGLYTQVKDILAAAGKTVFELPGIKPNPTYEQLLAGVKLVNENNIDLVLACGGGSVIDCAKGICVSAKAKGDPWQRYWIDLEPVDNDIIPLASILTMAGTGSEMNSGSVITHEEKTIKAGVLLGAGANPKFSILNPEFTYTVPKYQMVCGIFDTFSHLMEQYFSGEDDNVSDYIIEGLMRSLISSSRAALLDPQDYEARSNIMWCSTVALCTISGVSKMQDWLCHFIEHQLGAYTDCAHGAGLAAISPAYYRYIYPYGIKRFVRFAKVIWDVDVSGMTDEEAAQEGIDRLEGFIRELGLPLTLRELGTTLDMLPKIAATTVPGTGYKTLTESEILTVLKNCF